MGNTGETGRRRKETTRLTERRKKSLVILPCFPSRPNPLPRQKKSASDEKKHKSHVRHKSASPGLLYCHPPDVGSLIILVCHSLPRECHLNVTSSGAGMNKTLRWSSTECTLRRTNWQRPLPGRFQVSRAKLSSADFRVCPSIQPVIDDTTAVGRKTNSGTR